DWWWGVDNIQVYTGEPAPRDPALKVIIDRDTGAVSIINGTSHDVAIRGYEISSQDGVFDEASATFQADGDADWVQLTAPGSSLDLSEGHLTSTIVAQGSQLDLGSAWRPYFSDEGDIHFQYVEAGSAEPVLGLVEFVGGVDGRSYAFLDLNFDGVVDLDDWSEFLAISDTADLSALSPAQAYRKGDLDGNLRLGVNDYIVFAREYDRIHGAGALEAALAAVPEPTSALLGAFGVACLIGASRRRVASAALLLAAVASGTVHAGVTVDRMYQLGDDARENAVVGQSVGANSPDAPFGSGESLDSQGVLGGQQIVNVRPRKLSTFGDPVYVSTADRPDGAGGIGVLFDGAKRQNLWGQRLGTPATSISSTFAGGSIDYTAILDRGFQFWTKPAVVPQTQSGLAADDDYLVMDTNNHGALINSYGNFTMRYGLVDYEGVGTTAHAVSDQWYHVMVVRPEGVSNGSRMYVNGVVVAATPGDYLRGIPAGGTPNDIPDLAPLVLGGATVPLPNPNTPPSNFAFSNNYSGVIDDLEMFVVGFNATTDYGIFNPAVDNDYIAAFGRSNPMDLNSDGAVDLVDVNAFVSNWAFAKVVNGMVVG
ncbi:MAG: hypothetical protein KDA61_21435, partial [Planctomycetales bacterium]|nr:hypothetical protein [Planctomycetales bacterium]